MFVIYVKKGNGATPAMLKCISFIKNKGWILEQKKLQNVWMNFRFPLVTRWTGLGSTWTKCSQSRKNSSSVLLKRNRRWQRKLPSNNIKIKKFKLEQKENKWEWKQFFRIFLPVDAFHAKSNIWVFLQKKIICLTLKISLLAWHYPSKYVVARSEKCASEEQNQNST